MGPHLCGNYYILFSFTDTLTFVTSPILALATPIINYVFGGRRIGPDSEGKLGRMREGNWVGFGVGIGSDSEGKLGRIWAGNCVGFGRRMGEEWEDRWGMGGGVGKRDGREGVRGVCCWRGHSQSLWP